MAHGLSERRLSALLLGLAMVAAATLILWLNRGTTFFIDELTWVLQSPDLDAETALRPHEGHLVLIPRLVYKASLEIFGTAYLPIRLLGLAALLALVATLFAFLGRRLPGLVALAPCLVLLLFGADMLHVIVGNAFTVDLALACGVGALLALERDDRRGRAMACGLLCLGVLTYTVALAFVVAAGVVALLRPDRWRRIWVAAVPAALYLAWWVWARQQGLDSGDPVGLDNALLIPSWSFQSLGAVLSALSGLDFQFGDPETTPQAAPALAVIAIAAFAWHLGRGGAGPALLVVAAVPLTLWTLGALTANEFRAPTNARYLLPGAIAVLLVAAEAARGVRWSRGALIGLYLVVAAGLATNLYLLRDAAAEFRNGYTVQARAAFGALELAGARANPDFDAPPIGEESIIPGGQSPLAFPFDLVAATGESPVAAYREVSRRYGSLGFSATEIEAQAEPVRLQAAAVFAAATEPDP